MLLFARVVSSVVVILQDLCVFVLVYDRSIVARSCKVSVSGFRLLVMSCERISYYTYIGITYVFNMNGMYASHYLDFTFKSLGITN